MNINEAREKVCREILTYDRDGIGPGVCAGLAQFEAERIALHARRFNEARSEGNLPAMLELCGEVPALREFLPATAKPPVNYTEPDIDESEDTDAQDMKARGERMDGNRIEIPCSGYARIVR